MSSQIPAVVKARMFRIVMPPILWVFTVLFFSNAVASDTEAPWQAAQSDDEAIQILYRLYWQSTGAGDGTEAVLEAQTSYVGELDMVASLALLNNPEVLGFVEDVDRVDVINRGVTSPDLLYFEMKGPWPIPDSDAVLRVVRTDFDDFRTASIRLVADPSAMEDRGKRRFVRYNVTYTLEQQPEGRLKVTIDSHYVPPFNLPAWILKAGVPTAGIQHMERLIEALEGSD